MAHSLWMYSHIIQTHKRNKSQWKKDAHRYSIETEWERLYFCSKADEQTKKNNHSVDKWCSEEQSKKKKHRLKLKEQGISNKCERVFFCVCGCLLRENKENRKRNLHCCCWSGCSCACVCVPCMCISFSVLILFSFFFISCAVCMCFGLGSLFTFIASFCYVEAIGIHFALFNFFLRS